MVRDGMLISGTSGQPVQAENMMARLAGLPLRDAVLTQAAPDGDPSLILLRNCHLIVRTISLFASATGLLVLLGWWLDVAIFKSVLPGAATMKPNTALCFVLAGAALWALHGEPASRRALRRWAGQACAAVVSLVAWLTLSEYLFDFNAGIDTLFYPAEAFDPHATHVGRMAPATALAFVFTGSALWLLKGARRVSQWITQCGACATVLIGLIATLGYAYGIEDLYRFYSYSSVALHTALLFMVLGFGILLARTDYGFAATLASPDSGGFMARRILPIAVLAPFLIGWLRLMGERAGYYGTAFGLALFASANVTIFVVLVWFSARSLNRKDAERRRTQETLQQSEQRLRNIIDGLGPSMFVGLLSTEGIVLEANQQALAAAGLQPEDVLGKPLEETYWINYSAESKHQMRATIARAARGEASRYDLQIRVTENQFIPLDFSIQPFRDATGRVVLLVPSAVVIVERKQAEAALRESEERLRLALDAAHMGTFDWDVPHNRITWSRWHEELWGFKPGEFGGTYEAFSARVHPDDLPGINTEVERCIAAREPFARELRVVWPDASVHWIVGRGEFTFDANGQPLRMRGAVVDITARKRAEEQLQERERRLSTLISDLPGAVFRVHNDPTYRVEYISDQITAITGYPAEDFRTNRRNFGELMHPDDCDWVWKETQKALGEQRPYEVSYRFIDAHGREKWNWERGKGVFDADNELQAIEGFVLDITTRKQAEAALRQSEDHFRTLFEQAMDGILVADVQGHFLDANPAACQMLGYTREELLTLKNADIMAPAEVGRIVPETERLISAGVVRSEWQLRRRDGSILLAELSAKSLPDGRLQGLIRDITARRQAEDALQQLTQELEQRVIERTAELQAAQSELHLKNEELKDQNQLVQKANRLKSEFLANMSHELRTPLNAIIGFSELMHDGKVGAVAPNHKEYLGDILNSGKHLLQLINGVLDLAKVESGKMEFHPEPVNLSNLAGEVRDVLRTLMAHKRIGVAIEVEPALTGIVADPVKLKQVLYNYLSNAIKFSATRSQVIVRGRAEDAQHYRLEVEDQGAGIRAEDLHQLFVEFQQLDRGAAKKHAGTGLGLALTKRIVEAQGGHVGVTSVPGQGSVFYAVLPRVMRADAKFETRPL